MSTAASFEFRHLHRQLNPEELIPPMPSLLQQLEALAHGLHEARNQPVFEEEDLQAADLDPMEDDEAED